MFDGALLKFCGVHNAPLVWKFCLFQVSEFNQDTRQDLKAQQKELFSIVEDEVCANSFEYSPFQFEGDETAAFKLLGFSFQKRLFKDSSVLSSWEKLSFSQISEDTKILFIINISVTIFIFLRVVFPCHVRKFMMNAWFYFCFKNRCKCMHMTVKWAEFV